MRQASPHEASYLDIRLNTEGKLKEIQWCPDYRTGLTWEGSPGGDSAKLELGQRDGKHVTGRLQTAPGARPVDWAFDLRFDAPFIATVR